MSTSPNPPEPVAEVLREILALSGSPPRNQSDFARHRNVEEQSRVDEEQDRTIARHQAEIRELESQLQKASDKFGSIKSVPPAGVSVKSQER